MLLYDRTIFQFFFSLIINFLHSTLAISSAQYFQHNVKTTLEFTYIFVSISLKDLNEHSTEIFSNGISTSGSFSTSCCSLFFSFCYIYLSTFGQSLHNIKTKTQQKIPPTTFGMPPLTRCSAHRAGFYSISTLLTDMIKCCLDCLAMLQCLLLASSPSPRELEDVAALSRFSASNPQLENPHSHFPFTMQLG